MLRAAELVSLAISLPTIALCLVVVVLWAKAALKSWSWRGQMTAQDWFITGVFWGFIGESLDNLYWLFPWTASFLGLDATSDLFAFGVVPNIPFRQVAGGFAAYCHIRAHYEFQDTKRRPHDKILGMSIIAGFAYSVILLIIRFHLGG